MFPRPRVLIDIFIGCQMQEGRLYFMERSKLVCTKSQNKIPNPKDVGTGCKCLRDQPCFNSFITIHQCIEIPRLISRSTCHHQLAGSIPDCQLVWYMGFSMPSLVVAQWVSSLTITVLLTIILPFDTLSLYCSVKWLHMSGSFP